MQKYIFTYLADRHRRIAREDMSKGKVHHQSPHYTHNKHRRTNRLNMNVEDAITKESTKED